MTRSYLENKPIAVLSAGTSGIVHATDCAMEGKDVRLFEFPEFFGENRAIRYTNTIRMGGPQTNLYSFRRDGLGTIPLITTNMAEAVKGAGIIILTMPAVGFERLCEELAPLLEDGQVIHFMSGNFGCCMLRKKMREAGCTKKVIMGDWSSQPHGARIVTYAGKELPEIEMFYRAITLRGCALPSCDTEEWLSTLQYIPSMSTVKHPVIADSVVDVSFSNINPLMHPAASVLGVSTMENWTGVLKRNPFEYSIYSHAFCKSIAEVQYSIYCEQRATTDALGTGIQPLKKEQFFTRSGVLAPEYIGEDAEGIPFEHPWKHQEGAGPHTITHRYVTEDTPVGLSAQRAFARVFGIATPTMDAIITLASVMTKIDFNKTGWDLKTLGLDGMSKEQILDYLHKDVI